MDIPEMTVALMAMWCVFRMVRCEWSAPVSKWRVTESVELNANNRVSGRCRLNKSHTKHFQDMRRTKLLSEKGKYTMSIQL